MIRGDVVTVAAAATMANPVRRERIGATIGRLGSDDMARINVALAFVIGLAD